MDITSFSKAVDLFRQLHPEVTANQIMAFLWIAQNEGKYSLDMQKPLRVSKATAARLLDVLTNRGRGEKAKGMGLVYQVEASNDRRHKELWLTKEGQMLLKKLESL